MIEIDGLKKSFKGREVIRGLSFSVRRGEVFGILGRNGAGKTTTIRMILGLVPRDSGSVRFFGMDLDSSRQKILSRVGVLVDAPGFYPSLSAEANLRIFSRGSSGSLAHKFRISEILDQVGLAGVGGKLVGKYSLGMKQRLGIARSLLNDPEVLILDEPTNGLDPTGITDVRALIESLSTDQGKTVIICSHLLHEVELLIDSGIILTHGRVADKFTVSDIRSQGRNRIKVSVDDLEGTRAVLARFSDSISYSYSTDGMFIVKGEGLDSIHLNRVLVQAGIGVSSLSIDAPSLEEHFLRVTAKEDGVATPPE